MNKSKIAVVGAAMGLAWFGAAGGGENQPAGAPAPAAAGPTGAGMDTPVWKIPEDEAHPILPGNPSNIYALA